MRGKVRQRQRQLQWVQGKRMMTMLLQHPQQYCHEGMVQMMSDPVSVHWLSPRSPVRVPWLMAARTRMAGSRSDRRARTPLDQGRERTSDIHTRMEGRNCVQMHLWQQSKERRQRKMKMMKKMMMQVRQRALQRSFHWSREQQLLLQLQTPPNPIQVIGDLVVVASSMDSHLLAHGCHSLDDHCFLSDFGQSPSFSCPHFCLWMVNQRWMRQWQCQRCH